MLTNSIFGSVATTSTKPPSVIKQDIKRVLDRMQVQYRETKTGFECIHVPSIDVNSVLESLPPPTQRNHKKQGSVGSNETEGTRKSLGRKSSKMSFGKKSRDREPSIRDGKDKELPSRPSGGGALSITASSASSSFFHVSSQGQGHSEATRSDTLEPSSAGGTVVAEDASVKDGASTNGQVRSHSPTASKILPPIPRDFAPGAQQPLPQATVPIAPYPTGLVDQELFDTIGSNSLAVRFEINIVKVMILSFPLSWWICRVLTMVLTGTVATATWYPIPEVEW